MTVTNVEKDAERLTMRITAEFDAPIGRVWQMWEDPRLLERWWGPPTYPATVTDHDLTPGGRVAYHMTGPDGGTYPGWWKVLVVENPRLLEFEDGFSDSDGNPAPDMPTTRTIVTLTEQPDGRTSMVIDTRFPSLDAMETLIEMGMVEGITAAIGQIDGLLATDSTA